MIGVALGRRATASVRAVAVVLTLAAVVGIGGGVALHRLRGTAARPALPLFHGQAVWAPGARPAPGIALRDQDGAPVSLSALRGKPVLLTFLDSQCRSACPIEGRQLGAILRRLPAAERPTLLVLTVDPKGDTPAAIRTAMRKWALDGPWRWHWLNGTRAQLAGIWHAYGIAIVPKSGDLVHSLALYLIDGHGDERTAYLFPFLPGFVQGDLHRLSAEGCA